MAVPEKGILTSNPKQRGRILHRGDNETLSPPTTSATVWAFAPYESPQLPSQRATIFTARMRQDPTPVTIRVPHQTTATSSNSIVRYPYGTENVGYWKENSDIKTEPNIQNLAQKLGS